MEIFDMKSYVKKLFEMRAMITPLNNKSMLTPLDNSVINFCNGCEYLYYNNDGSIGCNIPFGQDCPRIFHLSQIV